MNKNKIYGLFLAMIVIAIDQLQKWYMLEIVQINERPPIEITPFFNLVMVWNKGISFGMFAGHNQPLPLIILALGISMVLLRWLWKEDNLANACAIGSVIGGALGNVIDRARFGAVADFFDFHAYDYHWPAFNIADSCIFIGVVVLCVGSMLPACKNN